MYHYNVCACVCVRVCVCVCVCVRTCVYSMYIYSMLLCVIDVLYTLEKCQVGNMCCGVCPQCTVL